MSWVRSTPSCMMTCGVPPPKSQAKVKAKGDWVCASECMVVADAQIGADAIDDTGGIDDAVFVRTRAIGAAVMLGAQIETHRAIA